MSPGAEGRRRRASGPRRRDPASGAAPTDATAVVPLVCVTVLALLAAATGRTAAQQVTFSPRADRAAERQLAAFLEAGRYSLWSRDTVVARGDTVRRPLLVLDATVRFAGRMEGDLWVVSGDLFLRPDARVGGDVSVLGGGYYASSRATVDGNVRYRPNLLLRAVRRDGHWAILHVGEERDPVDLHGLSGFHFPLYRRVSGWTFGWGGRVQAVNAGWQPSLEAAVRLNTEGTKELEGTVRHFWRPTGTFRFGVVAERAIRSNEEWMKADIPNTLRYLTAGEDFRDYYRSERVTLRAGWPARRGWRGAVGISWEEAESLEARSLSVLFDDDEEVRPNPGVDDGRIWSLEAAVGYRRRLADRRLRAELRLEGADSTAAGDFSFLMGESRLSWRRPGLLVGHRFRLFGLARFDLAGTPPRQRWTSLGGDPTLPTLDPLERRGERMFFLRTTYLVPVEPLRVAVLGPPRVFVRNSVGAAWNEGRTLRVEDNLWAGVSFVFFEAAAAIDVTRSDLDPAVVVQAVLPAGFRE